MSAEMKSWLKSWHDHFYPLPDDYLVIDCETTGLSPKTDLIVQLGWCETKNRKVVDNGGVILDWTCCSQVDSGWLSDKLESTRDVMFKLGNDYQWTMDVLSTGEPPIEALASLLVRLEDQDNIAVLTHNGWRFDAPMIENHFRRFLFSDYTFPHDSFYDTGVVEKGHQLGLLPKPGESNRDFSLRIMNRPAKVKWSLSNHCVPKYNLDVKHNLSMSNAHTAPHDTLVTHYLFEHYRSLLEEKNYVTMGGNRPNVC